MDQNYSLFFADGKDFTNNSCVGDKVDGGKGFITCRTIKGHVSMFCKMIFTNDSRVGDQVNGG